MQETENTASFLSKNAQKRLAKEKRREETSAAFRERRRMKKKAARERKKLEKNLPINTSTVVAKPISEPRGKIIIDLAYNDLMSKKELTSLSSQLCRCYSINRRALHPFELIFAGLDPNGQDSLSKVMSKAYPDFRKWNVIFLSSSIDEAYPNIDELIYLTADSNEELENVSDCKTHVIGGLVDRNRSKGVTFRRANELGISTAKFPLSKYVTLASSTVLTTVHAFELLVRFREEQNWLPAIQRVVPERKLAN